MKRHIVVFAGSRCLPEKESYYFDLAYRTGRLCAEAGFVVVTGGGYGLMDEVLRGATENGGKALAVGLNFENRIDSPYAHDTTSFDAISPRLEKLIEIGDAYIALPGGIGTFHEIMSVLALKHLKELPTDKPFILVDSYYQLLENLFPTMQKEGFISESLYSLYDTVNTPEEALNLIRTRLN